ncbi:MAG: winged helix-turn-helix domain-containing protein [Candidatus Pacearchaeota archaeon]|jgi:DNA-binding transcriptional ArsR family regulator
MNKKYVVVSLDDDKLSVLADVLSNKTSKKILEFLADNESSETEIAQKLNIPANTVNYNIKKLVECGLIETTKNYFWSVKGKKVLIYRVAKKSILISPKNSSNTTGIISALLATGIGAFLLKLYTSNISTNFQTKALEIVGSDCTAGSDCISAGSAPASMTTSAGSLINIMPEIWLWFLLGGIFALMIYMILNWRKL